MKNIYWLTPKEMAECDKRTIESGTPGYVLMERAGTAAAEIAMRILLPFEGTVYVFAGPGNNGGDGFVVARHLLEREYNVVAILATTPESTLSPDCELNKNKFLNLGGKIIGLTDIDITDNFPFRGLIIDSLLGTGFRGEIKGIFKKCLEVMEAMNFPVLAIDTPSGVNGLTGEADPSAIEADATVSFAAPKIGTLLPPGCGYTGALFVTNIGIKTGSDKTRVVMGIETASRLLLDRPVDGHKGTYGKLLLVGGSKNMPGAPQLMSMGALRSGAGLTTLSTPHSVEEVIRGNIPEVLNYPYDPCDISTLLDGNDFTAAAAGPGMGNTSDTKVLITHILQNWKIPLVLDADALNVLDSPDVLKSHAAPLVITPHPGEFSRLAGIDGADTKRQRETAAKYAEDLGITILLKGKPTMVFSPDGTQTLIPTGNTGLSKGGSGDVLTGIIGSFLAQGLSADDAAVLGAFSHGLSSEISAHGQSERAIIPSDVASFLGTALGILENPEKSGLLTFGGAAVDKFFNFAK